MGRKPVAAVVLGSLSLLAVGVTSVAAAEVEIDANGNAFTGGMSFEPRVAEAEVGDTVTWVNTDSIAPHTSTEMRNLWNVAGDNLGPPLTPVPGYAPGASAGRDFEAGTHSYYCVIHGAAAMSGVVEVPVSLRGKGSTVLARWAGNREAGHVFDVQRRRSGTGKWIDLAEGTKATKGSFKAGTGTWKVRARLRSAADPKVTTDWSPIAKTSR